MAKTVCKILGVVFLLVGVIGFAAPRLLGAHLSPAHNVVHIVSGIIALYFGFAGTLAGAKIFSLVFGVVYLALGILGMAMGDSTRSNVDGGSVGTRPGRPRHSHPAGRNLSRRRLVYKTNRLVSFSGCKGEFRKWRNRVLDLQTLAT